MEPRFIDWSLASHAPCLNGLYNKVTAGKGQAGKLVLCGLARAERVRVRAELLTGAARDIKAGQQWLAESWTVRQWWG